VLRRNFRRVDKGDFLLIHKTLSDLGSESDGVLHPGMVTPLEERYRVFGKGAESSNGEWYTWTPSTT